MAKEMEKLVEDSRNTTNMWNMPSASSMVAGLRDMAARIQALEKKVAELEKKPSAPKTV